MTDLVPIGAVALCALASAILTVGSRSLVHSVLWLGATLAATAALYLVVGASFFAGIQVLLYVGGVVTLVIFGVMLTRKPGEPELEEDLGRSVRGGLLASALFALLAWAVLSTDLGDTTRATVSSEALGVALLSRHALAFEVLSVLLLAVMIGAIVIARRRDHGAPAPRPGVPTLPADRTAEKEPAE